MKGSCTFHVDLLLSLASLPGVICSVSFDLAGCRRQTNNRKKDFPNIDNYNQLLHDKRVFYSKSINN